MTQERYKEPRPQTLELLRSAKLLYWPDLTDPNTPDPNELVLHETEQSSGFVDTHKFFTQLLPNTLVQFAPPEVTQAFTRLQPQVITTPDNPATVFLDKKNYSDYLIFTIFMCTGKTASQNELDPHLSVIRQLENLQHIEFKPEDKLITIPAAIIGFAITNKGGGKDGVNKTDNFIALLTQLTSHQLNGVFSPLCAQYDARVQPNGNIINYKLRENLATEHTARAANWINMLSLVNRLKNPNFTILWSTLTGDADHIGSIVPRVISYHAQKQEIAKMFLLIDRQFYQFQALTQSLNSGIKVTNLSNVENLVDRTLESLFGSSWQTMTETDLYKMITKLEEQKTNKTLDQNSVIQLQLLYVTKDMAYPTIRRFINENRNIRATLANLANLDDDLAKLSAEEWQEWCAYKGFSSENAVEKTQEFFARIQEKVSKQSEVTAVADALHEVILYFGLGVYAAQNNLGVIGLDIDHDPYMTIAWEAGWKYSKNSTSEAPVAYARNPDTGKTSEKNAGLEYNELYLRTLQTDRQGKQRLNSIALREPWFVFV